MPQSTRVPLLAGISQRNVTEDKDALAVNIFYDKNKVGSIFATKRPGTSLYYAGSSTGSGIFTHGTNLYVFQNDSYIPTVIAE